MTTIHLASPSPSAGFTKTAPPSAPRTCTPAQWDQLRSAVAADDDEAFEALISAIVRDRVRTALARRHHGPAVPWLPSFDR